jgi:predicted Zn-dependent protease
LISSCASTKIPQAYHDKYPALKDDHIDLIMRTDNMHKEFVSKGLIQTDPLLVNYVQKLAAPMLAQVNADVEIRIFIFRDSAINAFAMPNGNVYFNEGLLASLDNSAQLAFVMGHEISHVTHQHSIKQRRQNSGTLAAAHVGDIFLSGIGLPGLAYLPAGLSITGYSRDAEREADFSGLDLMCGAGFDGAQAEKALEALVQHERFDDKLKGSIWGSHPGIGERMQTVAARAQVPDCMMSSKNDDYARDVLPKVVGNVIEMNLQRRQYLVGLAQAEEALKNNFSQVQSLYYLGEVNRRIAADPEGMATQLGEMNDGHLRNLDKYRQEVKAKQSHYIKNARTNFLKAIEIDKKYANSYKGMGLLANDEGNREEAAKYLNTYLSLADNPYQKAYINNLLRQWELEKKL